MGNFFFVDCSGLRGGWGSLAVTVTVTAILRTNVSIFLGVSGSSSDCDSFFANALVGFAPVICAKRRYGTSTWNLIPNYSQVLNTRSFVVFPACYCSSQLTKACNGF